MRFDDKLVDLDPDGTPSAVRRQEIVNQLGGIVLGEQPLDAVLERVTELAQQAVPSARDVSVTLLETRHVGEGRGRGATQVKVRTVAFRGALAVELDERQYAAAAGPCMDAAISGNTILLDTAADLAGEATYPEFSAAAQHVGVPQTLAVGLPLPNRTVGALNLYAMPSARFDEVEIESAERFAAFAAVAIANATLYADALALTADMVAAMVARSTIEQAKGVLMERHGCSQAEAFEILRRASSRANIKLRDLATMVVKGEPLQGGS
jgi:GAF domain-containing protein